MPVPSRPEASRRRRARAARLAPLLLLLGSPFLTAPAFAQADAPAPTPTTESSSQPTAAPPSAEPEGGEFSESMLVVAERADRRSTGATGLDLEIQETPQSISVISSELMDDFAVDDLNDALRLAPGINVEEWETNRTNYMARGFDIVNTQIDGVGMPNDWGIVTGANDSFGYEKLEVIRGANGQLTGVGNASGTINFVRKRPTNELQGEVNLKMGSWGNQRIEADWSTPLTPSGSWAGRVVAAYEEGGSYLRLLDDDRMFFYGVVDGQLGERSTLSVGFTFQDANTDGNLWGGLPFAQSDGTQAEFPRDATTSQDWTRWDTENQNGFVELGHQLGGDWFLKATYNYRQYDELSRLFYSWAETGIDPQTGEGVLGYPGNYGGDVEAHLGELSASGRYTAFGRSHQAVVGVAVSRSTSLWNTADPDPYEVVMPGFPYPGDVLPEPEWGPTYLYEESRQELRRAFGATGLSLTDRLTAIVGVNYTWFRREGKSIYDAEPYEQEQGKASPYAGLTFAFTDRVLAYASYSDIYQPQDQRDIDFNWLEPTQGVNFEAGVKAEWFDHRLLTTVALFSAEQKGLSTLAGYTLPDFVYYYEGVDVDSRGFELEATGKLSDQVDLVVGYTALKLTGADGEESYPWTPRRTATLALGVRLPALPQVRFGLAGRWQSEVSNFDDAVVAEIRQGSYAVLGLSAEWKVNERLSLQVNVDNLTDEKYIGSVYYVGYYGAPRSGSIGLHWRF